MLIPGNFKSVAELDKAYEDHIHSLKMWGGEADIEGLEQAWRDARLDWCIDHPLSTGPF